MESYKKRKLLEERFNFFNLTIYRFIFLKTENKLNKLLILLTKKG